MPDRFALPIGRGSIGGSPRNDDAQRLRGSGLRRLLLAGRLRQPHCEQIRLHLAQLHWRRLFQPEGARHRTRQSGRSVLCPRRCHRTLMQRALGLASAPTDKRASGGSHCSAFCFIRLPADVAPQPVAADNPDSGCSRAAEPGVGSSTRRLRYHTVAWGGAGVAAKRSRVGSFQVRSLVEPMRPAARQ
jgi:hypothetical protein